MGLGEHELEGWEDPTHGEVSRDVAVDVSIHTQSGALTNARSCRRWEFIIDDRNHFSCPQREVIRILRWNSSGILDGVFLYFLCLIGSECFTLG